MIVTEYLTKKFDDFTAVDGVSLRVEPGQVLVLLGPNGAGKTTTVRMLTSILLPTRGRAWVAGFDVVQEPQKVRSSVGVLTEHHGLYGRMNAVEYLEFFSRLYGLERAIARARMDAHLERFGLASAKTKRLGEYSKGMRQKLALVRALLHDPSVLLLDEPTSAMDPESARVVRDAIHGLRSNERTIILCTHNLVEAEILADRVAIIRRGRIIANDTLEGLKSTWLGPVEYEAHLARPLDGWKGNLPDGATLIGQGESSLRFRVANPEQDNPRLLRSLMDARLEVCTFTPVQRSLEQAYLEVVGSSPEEAADVE